MKVKVNGAWVDVPAYKIKNADDVVVIEGEITIVSTTSSVGIDIYDSRITEDNFLYGAVWSDAYIAEPLPNHVIFITAHNSNPSGLICGTSQYTAQSTTTITTNAGRFNLFAGRVQLRAAATRQWAAGDIYKYKIILKS